MDFTAAIAAAALLIPAPNAQIFKEPCPAPSEAMTTGACADPDGRVYLPPGSTRFMREHELGHVYFWQRVDAGEQHKIKRELGLPESAPWDGPDPYANGNERAADTYAACRLRLDPDHGWESSYDYYPSRRVLLRVCRTIGRAADYPSTLAPVINISSLTGWSCISYTAAISPIRAITDASKESESALSFTPYRMHSTSARSTHVCL